MSTRILLRSENTNNNTSTLEATLEADGKLVLSGCDAGPAAKEFFGDSDYEYWITVPAEARDRLLLELLKQCFGNRSTPSSDFMEWLKRLGIPYEFMSY